MGKEELPSELMNFLTQPAKEKRVRIEIDRGAFEDNMEEQAEAWREVFLEAQLELMGIDNVFIKIENKRRRGYRVEYFVEEVTTEQGVFLQYGADFFKMGELGFSDKKDGEGKGN